VAVFYNEFDPGAAEWLRELMKASLIPEGVVDERDIQDIAPDDIRGHRSVHLFAGIGVWSYALRLAGWPDDRPVWTCSCPCQPFSTAGKGDGFADERHLWPAAFHLLSECRPLVCFGEQVASDDGFAWLDLVQADLESVGYTVGTVVTPAAGYGAPHGRHRIYWVADATGDRRPKHKRRARKRKEPDVEDLCESGGVADPIGCGRDGRAPDARWESVGGDAVAGTGEACNLGITDRAGPLAGRVAGKTSRHGSSALATSCIGPGPVNGFWRDAEWVYCLPEPRYPEGCWRPVEPSTFPLAHGAAGRVGRLRGYGNGLCAPQAAAFIRAWEEVRNV
jgi:DNA (cytosine-5)-methyltransferase 1